MNFFHNKKIKVLGIMSGIFLTSAFVILPIMTHADNNPSTGYQPLAPLQVGSQQVQTTDVFSYVKGMYTLLIALSGVLAVLMIVYGGIIYMTTDAIGGKYHGKELIKQALWGLLLVIGSYLILYTINPNLVGFSSSYLTPGNYNQQASGSPTPDQAGDWCTTVQVSISGSNYPYTTDCQEEAKQQCDARVVAWNSNSQNNKYTATDCQLTNGDQTNNLQQYCTDVSVNGTFIKKDCVNAYNAGDTSNSQASFNSCMEKFNNYQAGKVYSDAEGWHYDPNDPVRAQGNTCARIDGNYCVVVVHLRSTGNFTTNDCSAGAIFTPNPNAAQQCNQNAAAWRNTPVTYQASACVDQSSQSGGTS